MMRSKGSADLAREAELWFGSGRGLNNGIKEILDRAATEERDTHAYQNQTGHAQQGTKAAVVSEGSDEFKATLEMGEEYSSYLVIAGSADSTRSLFGPRARSRDWSPKSASGSSASSP